MDCEWQLLADWVRSHSPLARHPNPGAQRRTRIDESSPATRTSPSGHELRAPTREVIRPLNPSPNLPIHEYSAGHGKHIEPRPLMSRKIGQELANEPGTSVEAGRRVARIQ
jgi:hypothetical protein